MRDGRAKTGVWVLYQQTFTVGAHQTLPISFLHAQTTPLFLNKEQTAIFGELLWTNGDMRGISKGRETT